MTYAHRHRRNPRQGKAKTKLADTGKAKVKAKIVFKPNNGTSVTKAITLKKSRRRRSRASCG